MLMCISEQINNITLYTLLFQELKMLIKNLYYFDTLSYEKSFLTDARRKFWN